MRCLLFSFCYFFGHCRHCPAIEAQWMKGKINSFRFDRYSIKGDAVRAPHNALCMWKWKQTKWARIAAQLLFFYWATNLMLDCNFSIQQPNDIEIKSVREQASEKDHIPVQCALGWYQMNCIIMSGRKKIHILFPGHNTTLTSMLSISAFEMDRTMDVALFLALIPTIQSNDR